ncbi:mechanosensitive ion channel family protein [Flavobacterium zepuense]|uniref:Mechanosensitive ion channel family protein n=1 Tax=Flavobacterium zepuense TaxID=2593302 RepID=A0A552V4F2_9FLAO|nr:mechanosensitive ion channel family protein [Flavobacterium zepuense]TRW25327.1 mechanosensitive ion channel family protein [Flavobacterium zepuense]
MPFQITAQTLSDLTGEKQEVPEQKFPDDSLGRQNPRGTVSGFIQAVADQNYTRASRFLDLTKRTQRRLKERERIVKVMQRLLDQGGDIMPYSLISNKATGRTDDDLPQNTDLIGTVTSDGVIIDLYVENKAAEDAPPVWLFSEETIAAVAALKINDNLLIDRALPQVLKDTMLGGVPIGHWLALIVLVIISYLIAWGIVFICSFLIRKIWRKAETEPTSGIIAALVLPFRLCVALWIFVTVSQQIGISIIVRQRFSAITLIVGVLAFLILLWRLTDFISTFTKDRMTQRGRVSAISVILFVRRAFKIAIIVFGIISVLGVVGVDVNTWFAALGIGGIALALGAQKTVENFVGSVTLIADQPVRVGDFCKVGEVSGTVEQIGIRSTRLRTGERTVVTIPNGDFSSNRIENYAHRDRFLFDPVLEFRKETTPDQVRYLLVELRAILYAHPMVNPDPAKVRFTGFNSASVKIEVYAYINAANFDAFQEVQEDLLLRMMDVVDASGTGFALPSQTVYLTRDKVPAEDKAATTSETVKQWKEENDLQLPGFSEEKIKSIKSTLSYPPEGSALNKDKGATN